MDRIGIGGLSLQAAELRQLERLRKAGEGAQDEFLRELADALFASEVVLLSTCNRVEVVFAREEGQAPSADDLAPLCEALGADAELSECMRMLTGRDAAQHLLRVACSLDSVVQGEDQILGQVRAAFMHSEFLGLTGPVLGPIFEAALQVGKQVRTQTELSRHPVSITSVGVGLLRERVSGGQLPLRALVVGAGATGRLAAKTLHDQGFEVSLIVNRSLAGARELAQEFGAKALTLAEFQSTSATELGEFDALVSATSASGFVIDAQRLISLAGQNPRGLSALDLALPRDLEPTPAMDGLHVIDLEEVQRGAQHNRELRAASAIKAEEFVQQKLKTLEYKASQKRVSDQVAGYQRDRHELIEREMRQLVDGPLANLSHAERSGVMHWAQSAFGRANHLSLAFCKRMARNVPYFEGLEEEETTG
jgi:glutamyl-tRNA reductase